MMFNAQRRYIWVVKSPEGKIRLYLKQESLEADLPGRVAFKKRALDTAGTRWEYGEVTKFTAMRLPIRDTGTPSPPT